MRMKGLSEYFDPVVIIIVSTSPYHHTHNYLSVHPIILLTSHIVDQISKHDFGDVINVDDVTNVMF